MLLHCGKYILDLTTPKVMGILNLTPDSFYDGNQYSTIDLALRRAEKMVKEGVAIIDVGGESTRPNAEEINSQQELDRVMPVIEQLVANFDIPLSIDTYKPEVMLAAYQQGISLINDIKALTMPGALEVAAKLDIPVCLMHMQNTPKTMQQAPYYENVVIEVKKFLMQRIKACKAMGKDLSQLIIDPGFGFGKNLAHNLQLLRELSEFKLLNCPILVGISRKGMIGQILGSNKVKDRLYGSLAAAVLAYNSGASIIRVHDVKATVDGLKVAAVVRS